nr:MAG TPA: hypothetical protein [Microviridae sp.]
MGSTVMRARTCKTRAHTQHKKHVVRRLTPATGVASVGTPCREMRRFAERSSLRSHIYLIGFIRMEQGRPCSIRPPLRSGPRVLIATCGAGFDSGDYIKVISHVSV